MLQAITADIQQGLITINHKLRTNENCLKYRKQLYELIQFQSDARQLSGN